MTYLQIRGTLEEDMTYRPRAGYESARRVPRDDGDPAYDLVLMDADGRVLLNTHPQVAATGCGSAGDPLHYRVRGALPIRPDAAAYELRRGERRLYAATIPSVSPAVTVSQCHSGANGVTVRWQPCPPTGEAHCEPCPPATPGNTWLAPPRRATYSIVIAMESGRRITLARGLTEPAYRVDLTVAPVSGKGTLYIVANDGVRSSEVEAGPVEVPARPPTIHILAPADGVRLPFGIPVSVLGCCVDMGGKPCSQEDAVWSLDGERFAAGTFVAVIPEPGPGTHRLTFSHLDHGAKAVAVDCEFTVEEPDENYRQWQALTASD